ncbi:MAG: hypothetical protein ACREN8_09955, partial [Candidatus Dormibacteraceae bacterium]
RADAVRLPGQWSGSWMVRATGPTGNWAITWRERSERRWELLNASALSGEGGEMVNFAEDSWLFEGMSEFATNQADRYLESAHENWVQDLRGEMDCYIAAAMGAMREKEVLERLNRGEGFDG